MGSYGGGSLRLLGNLFGCLGALVDKGATSEIFFWALVSVTSVKGGLGSLQLS